MNPSDIEEMRDAIAKAEGWMQAKLKWKWEKRVASLCLGQWNAEVRRVQGNDGWRWFVDSESCVAMASGSASTEKAAIDAAEKHLRGLIVGFGMGEAK